MPVDTIPSDLLPLIFSNVPLYTKDYFRLSQVCKSWKELSRSEICCKIVIQNQLTKERDVLDQKSPLFEFLFFTFEILVKVKRGLWLKEIVRNGFDILLEKECDERTIDSVNLLQACNSKYAGIVKLLLKREANPNQTDPSNNLSPLYRSSLNGFSETVKALLDFGAKVDSGLSYENQTPLEVACRKGHFEVVKLLLKRGADVNRKMDLGYTPLLHSHNIEIVKLLIEHNADVHYKMKDGRNVLHVATENGNLEVVKMLEEVVEISRGYIYTPLHIAIMHGHIELVKFWLEKTPNDLDQRDPEGHFPIHVACSHLSNDVAEILLQHGANTNVSDYDDMTPLRNAISHCNADMVELLLKYGVDVNIAPFGHFPIHFASQVGSVKIVKMLLKCNADVNCVEKFDGKTPLFYATECRQLEVVQFLLENGAEVNRATTDDRTPLSVALLRNKRDLSYSAIVRLLIENGGTVREIDELGNLLLSDFIATMKPNN